MSVDSINPYAPPAAEVQDLAPVGSDLQTPWFAVSVFKLMVMNLCTLGLYQIFWFYKHWARVKEREDDTIWPAPRALFAVFFVYSLFGKMRDSEQNLAGSSHLSAGVTAIGWILCVLTQRAPAPFFLIALLAFFFTLPAQAAANRANSVVAPDHDRNGSFSGWNWLAIVLGGIWLVLTVIGSFLPR